MVVGGFAAFSQDSSDPRKDDPAYPGLPR
jgi:hypothetical protein